MFSTLFKTILVITAYEKIGEDFSKIMRHPWIVSEVLSFERNSSQIVYVGHNNQGAKLTGDHTEWLYWMLSQIWETGFTQTILDVLCHDIQIYAISDFKPTLPVHIRALTAAYKQMTRHDYLLTAVILSQTRQ